MLGFAARYARIHDQLRLLLNVGGLEEWNCNHHGGKLAICDLVAEQHPFVIFYGDVGTGKTAMAECIANKLVAEARSEELRSSSSCRIGCAGAGWSARWER